MTLDMHALAVLGAVKRLQEIEAEAAALHEAFPEIRAAERTAQQRANAAHMRAAKAAKQAAGGPS